VCVTRCEFLKSGHDDAFKLIQDAGYHGAVAVVRDGGQEVAQLQRLRQAPQEAVVLVKAAAETLEYRWTCEDFGLDLFHIYMGEKCCFTMK